MGNGINNTKINGDPWKEWFISIAKKDANIGGNKETISSTDLKIAKKEGKVVDYVPISNHSGAIKIRINNRDTVFYNTDFHAQPNFDLNNDNEISKQEMEQGLINIAIKRPQTLLLKKKRIRVPKLIAKRVIEAARFALKNGSAHKISWKDFNHGHVLLDLGRPLPENISSKKVGLRLLYKYARRTSILYHTEEHTRRCIAGDKKRNLLQTTKTGKIEMIQGERGLFAVTPVDIIQSHPNTKYVCEIYFKLSPNGKYPFSNGQRMNIWFSFINQ